MHCTSRRRGETEEFDPFCHIEGASRVAVGILFIPPLIRSSLDSIVHYVVDGKETIEMLLIPPPE